MKDFAHIRLISDRQVLGMKDHDDEDFNLKIVFEIKAGALVDTSISFKEEDHRDAAFERFQKGALDKYVLEQIEEMEELV